MDTLQIILLVLFIAVPVLVIGFLINHRYQLRKELRKFPPPGKLVDVGNYGIHVYTAGSGDTTLVFLSGLGTTCPTIDFKPLWTKLVDDYRIVVIERPGYGWSETTKNPRDIDTLLKETRKALQISEEKGPYVLIPHSMSGLVALYWAQTYPQEVKAIIGLDPTVPEFVGDSLELPSKIRLYIMYAVSRLGLTRLMPEDAVEKTFPLLEFDYISREDKEKYLAIFYKSAYSREMLSEVDWLKKNAKKVGLNTPPIETPMYFFISDGEEVPGNNWRELLSSYVSQMNIGKYKFLDVGHYLYIEKPKTIAEEIKTFLEETS